MIFEKFLQENNIEFKKDFLLSKLSFYKIGGPARFVVFPDKIEVLPGLFKEIKNNNLKYFVLGKGANILFDDRGFNGVIISTKNLNRTIIKKDKYYFEAGISIDILTEIAIENSLSGLEFAGGLPGSLGGAIFMNARCYGGQFSDIVKNVDVLDLGNFNILNLNNINCEFGYKNSIFQYKQYLILGAELFLKSGDKYKIQQITMKNYYDRVNKGQFEYPNSGCVFKNNYDYGIPTGKLIEELNLKGFRKNDIMIYPKHGNFFINLGNGKAEDVLWLINFVKEKIKNEYGIEVEEEVIYVPY